MTKISHTAARLQLAKQRQMTSLIDQEILSHSTKMMFTKADWVPLYFDRGNKVTSDDGQMSAYRAVTLKGELLWMVFTPTKECGYHASCSDPFEAMECAQTSWANRRALRQDWDQVEHTARDLLTGRKRFDVRIEDLAASPLCTLGIEGFRATCGMKRVTRIPGWFAALLMKIEPQMGFVIHAAMQRHAASQAVAVGEHAAA